ncbi:MAG TPA: Flp family type IVb pilin [Gaiellaceae bacterium]
MLKLYAPAQALYGDAADAVGRREGGQTMAEYGVILSVITVAIITAVSVLSGNIQSAFEAVAGLVPG